MLDQEKLSLHHTHCKNIIGSLGRRGRDRVVVGYYWCSNVCFLPWPSSWNRQRRKIESKTLRQTRSLHFSNSQLPFISSNIPVSQLIRYSTACAEYSDFLDRAQLLTQNLLKQDHVAPRLKSSLRKLYGRHHNLVDRYEIFISQMTMDLFLFTYVFFPDLSLQILLPDLIVYMSNTTGDL